MPVKKSKIKKDYNTILLEKLGHDFGIFGEGLTHVAGKVDKIERDVNVLKEDMSQVKVDIVLLREDMTEVKGNVNIIRSELKEKIGRDEFKLLENRVARLEKASLT